MQMPCMSLTYRALSGPDGTNIYLIYSVLQSITANGFWVQADF